MQESSQLVLFEIQGRAMEPAKLASIHVKGVIAPELLYYDVSTEHSKSNVYFTSPLPPVISEILLKFDTQLV